MNSMLTYPKKLRPKDLKRISKYDCDSKIKEAYIKYLTNYSFKEFVGFCQDNDEDLENLIFKFTDLQLEKFRPNSMIWISHALVNFLIYFDVNLDYKNYYDAYASALQYSVLYFAMATLVEKKSLSDVELSEHTKICFEKFFSQCSDFRFNLEKDCELAFKSFNNDFDFTSEEFYIKIKTHFDECDY